ncbi:hypothetical protein DACRYDRAFT_22406 [Dacryopinax primogenitus]|uniref:Uncharacterized protein n=1 Tax=Dacryopinax primogenitus (strain DJM 731) TaxID=1858805 RepID=M5FZR8_DACPD|nr:uncharacterized protein DACRYDRAFT_22406 [Dacryopinax primogenitus]EJU02004.1 hypothetical protein DACRYDRAFT_22406 [Dacryopinax primogenitus]
MPIVSTILMALFAFMLASINATPILPRNEHAPAPDAWCGGHPCGGYKRDALAETNTFGPSTPILVRHESVSAPHADAWCGGRQCEEYKRLEHLESETSDPSGEITYCGGAPCPVD